MHLNSRKGEARCHRARHMLEFGTEPLSQFGVLVNEERLGLQTGCVNSGRAEKRTLEEERCILAVRYWGHRSLLVLKGKTYPGDKQD